MYVATIRGLVRNDKGTYLLVWKDADVAGGDEYLQSRLVTDYINHQSAWNLVRAGCTRPGVKIYSVMLIPGESDSLMLSIHHAKMMNVVYVVKAIEIADEVARLVYDRAPRQYWDTNDATNTRESAAP